MAFLNALSIVCLLFDYLKYYVYRVYDILCSLSTEHAFAKLSCVALLFVACGLDYISRNKYYDEYLYNCHSLHTFILVIVRPPKLQHHKENKQATSNKIK